MSIDTDVTFRRLLDIFALAGGTRIPSGKDFEAACLWLDAESGIDCKLPFAHLLPTEGIIDVPHVIMYQTKSPLWDWLEENPHSILLVRGSRRHDADAYWTVTSFNCADNMAEWIKDADLQQFNLVAGSLRGSTHRCVAALSLDSWAVKKE